VHDGCGAAVLKAALEMHYSARRDEGVRVICCQFIFQPSAYDDDFHRLDAEIDAYARALPGFVRTETWHAHGSGAVNAVYYFADREAVAELARFPQHREAKGQVQRWYDGYRVVVSEVTATYGDGRLTGDGEITTGAVIETIGRAPEAP
jgi:heme-degrading monooxygenase HmoA